MTIEAKALRDAICVGINSLVGRSIQMTGDRGEDPHPEYLTTASVAFKLCDLAARIGPRENITLRCEEQTGDVWRRGTVRKFLQGATTASQALQEAKARMATGVPAETVAGTTAPNSDERREAERKGNIDITLYKGTGFEHPFAIIENKGLLNFTEAGALYVGSAAEMNKDLARNVDFVKEHGDQGGVQYSAFTFYLRDYDSGLKQQGEQFCADKRAFFEQHLRTLNIPAELKTNVLVKEWDADLFEDTEEIEQLDREGEQPAPWHVAYGVISIYRVGEDISDEQQLWAEAD